MYYKTQYVLFKLNNPLSISNPRFYHEGVINKLTDNQIHTLEYLFVSSYKQQLTIRNN